MSPRLNDDQRAVMDARHRCEQAGYPLRDRYGYEASQESVLHVLSALAHHRDDREAADAIGIGNITGACELSSGLDTPTDETYEMGIVTALR